MLYEDSFCFFYIWDILRFEYVLNKVYVEEFVEVFYVIYILEKRYFGFIFLKNYKFQVWLDIMKVIIKKEMFVYMFYGLINRKKVKYYEG